VRYKTALMDGCGFAKAAYVPGRRTLAHRFLQRVLKLQELDPERRLVVCWDPEDNVSKRVERFPDYKKSRRGKEPDEEYRGELHDLLGLLTHLGIDQAWSVGWEADDVIGTLARCLPQPVLVLTRDQDLLQLVSREVHVLLRIGSEESVVDVLEANDRLPVPLRLFRDYKALAGDTGDDVPGVPGIGEKKAVALLGWNPSVVPEMMALGHPQGDIPRELEGLVKKLRAAGREHVGLMRFLVSLHDVPVTFRRGRLDPEAAFEVARDLGLKIIGRRIAEVYDLEG